jgi:CRP/FNR family cyclic AMP-dependent transcriptional regulator
MGGEMRRSHVRLLPPAEVCPFQPRIAYFSGVTTNAEMLAGVPIFALLDDQERAVLAERLDVEKHAKGAALFNRGDPGDALYVVREGEVEIWVKNDTGERMVLETCKRGDFFGEISLLDGGPRTAGAVATSDVELLVVDREDLEELIKLRPAAAMDLLSAAGRRLRGSAEMLRRTVSRNVNEEVEDTRSTVMKVADWISEFSGSLQFLFIHIGIFAVWILLNSGPLSHIPHVGGFDPFPYGLLTMCVSLEAIILSVFVLLSQSRQVARDRIRSDIEYQVNVRAELEIMHLHEKVDQLHEQLTKRLHTLEKTARSASSVGG